MSTEGFYVCFIKRDFPREADKTLYSLNYYRELIQPLQVVPKNETVVAQLDLKLNPETGQDQYHPFKTFFNAKMAS